MNYKIRNSLYILSITPAFAVIFGNLTGGWFTYLNIVYSLVFLAIIEWLSIPTRSNQSSHKHDKIPAAILLMHVPLQIISVASLYYGVKSNIIQNTFILSAAISTGLNSGSSAVVVAHELIHQKSKIKQAAGKLLLFTAGNIYFFIDHIYIHHKWVATVRDNASARLGESIYRFFFRSAFGQFVGSITHEKNRLKKLNKFGLGLSNYVVRQLFLQILFAGTIYYFLGYLVLAAWILQCLFASFLLEYVNYIQHYGLNRNENERVTEEHSWDCDQFVSRFVLIDLARHADHHYYASKPYHTLNHYQNSPKLPSGYVALFFVAAIPKLWFAVMDKRIKN